MFIKQSVQGNNHGLSAFSHVFVMCVPRGPDRASRLLQSSLLMQKQMLMFLHSNPGVLTCSHVWRLDFFHLISTEVVAIDKMLCDHNSCDNLGGRWLLSECGICYLLTIWYGMSHLCMYDFLAVKWNYFEENSAVLGNTDFHRQWTIKPPANVGFLLLFSLLFFVVIVGTCIWN